jgi:hypothetical protein
LRPWDGGTEELSGVFGGSPSLAPSSATRAASRATSTVSAAICPACASTNAISSSLENRCNASRVIES